LNKGIKKYQGKKCQEKEGEEGDKCRAIVAKAMTNSFSTLINNFKKARRGRK